MKTIYFVRHGESEFNVNRFKAGSSNTPLTQRGRDQAKQTGANAQKKGIKVDIVISSPLDRAHDTAKIIAEHIDYPLEEILLDEMLRERNFGAAEGRNINHLGISDEEYMNNPFSLDHLDGVEKITDLQYRANKLWQQLLERPEKTILIVSHGAFGRSVMRAAKNAPLSEDVGYINNAEVIRLI